jgi:hypothetical protein
MDFEELYRVELAEHERLRSATAIPLGLLTIFGGIIGGMVPFLWWEAAPGAIALISLTCAATVTFLRALYHLIRSYHGHTYEAIPFALDCKSYRDDLRGWYAVQGGDAASADAEFRHYIEEQYAAAADHNGRVNAAKSAHLYKANAAVICCGLLVLAALVPFWLHRATTAAFEPVQTAGTSPVAIPEEGIR